MRTVGFRLPFSLGWSPPERAVVTKVTWDVTYPMGLRWHFDPPPDDYVPMGSPRPSLYALTNYGWHYPLVSSPVIDDYISCSYPYAINPLMIAHVFSQSKTFGWVDRRLRIPYRGSIELR